MTQSNLVYVASICKAFLRENNFLSHNKYISMSINTTSTLNSKTNSSNIIILIFVKFNHPIKLFPRWEKVFVVHLVTDEMFGKGSLWKGNE